MPKRRSTSISGTSSLNSKSESQSNNNHQNHHTMWSSGRSSKKTKTTINEAAAEALFDEIMADNNNNNNNNSADGDDYNHHSSSTSLSNNNNNNSSSSNSNTTTNLSTVATMEGISELCHRLGLDPLEDVRVLVLLWKFNATSKPAQMTKKEWMAACHRWQVDSLEKLKAMIPSLETGFLDQEEFKDFYKFCFQFNREGTHKTLDKELVILLLQLVLSSSTNRVPPDRVTSFCSFLEQSKDYTRITLDQWTSFWDFSQECDDLSSYDEATSAWPVMIDEYVEYMEQQQQQQQQQTKGK